MPILTGINHINLSIRNLTASKCWYSEVLGFTVLRDTETDGFRRAVLCQPGRPSVFGLTQHPSNSGATFSETRTGMDHLAFTVDSLADLDLWRERLNTLKVPHSSSRAGLLVLRDPDDIQVELCLR